jgi:hypothetical protein
MNTGAHSWFPNVSTYSEVVIKYRKKNSLILFKPKLKIIREFGCVLGIVGKPSVSRI